MTESIHGHEVMKMMIEHDGQFTRSSLITAIEARFGTTARFHTCMDQDMTVEALIDFLAERGKFIDSETGFNTHADKICAH